MPSPADRLSRVVRTLRRLDVPFEYAEAQSELRDLLPRKQTYWDRAHGLRAMARYISETTPEILDANELSTLEIGPGVGLWMEIARELGHSVSGVDAAVTNATMECYQELTTARDLSVRYCGAETLVADHAAGKLPGAAFDLVHSRGSLDAYVARYSAADQGAYLTALAAMVADLLKPDGVWIVAHNRDPKMTRIQDGLEAFDGLTFERVSEQVTRHRKQ